MRRVLLVLAMLAAALGIGLVLSGPASAIAHDDGGRISHDDGIR